MKRILTIVLAVVLVTAMLTGCKTENKPGGDTPAPTPATTPASTPGNGGGTEKSVKTGLAISTSIGKSADAGENEGLAQADSIVVAVTVDAEGKIIKCVIDSAQSKINFDSSGKLTTPMDTEFKTKNELGEDYGMKKASSIGKEWNEQAAALASYVQGKTIDEVRNIAVDETSHPTGDDLKSSVTISIGGYIDLIEKAVENAKDLGAKENDVLKIGVATSMDRSADAGENPGLAEIYSTYVAATLDSQGRITSCIIDASQSRINFDSSGKITTDLTAAPLTKNELGENYGMKKASSIGKEWNEQAEAFAKYVTGKTVSEVQSIAVNEDDAPTGSDLAASVTIGIGDFKNALARIA